MIPFVDYLSLYEDQYRLYSPSGHFKKINTSVEMDIPSDIHIDEVKIRYWWSYNGKTDIQTRKSDLYRDNGPAFLSYGIDLILREMDYFTKRGFRHRIDGPASIKIQNLSKNGTFSFLTDWFINDRTNIEIPKFIRDNEMDEMNLSIDDIMILKLTFPILNFC